MLKPKPDPTRVAVLEARMEARHEQYSIRFEAVQRDAATALAAQKESGAAAFAAQKEAIAVAKTEQKESAAKAEAAQTTYNETHNGLLRAMGEQYAHMMPRTEIVVMIDALKEKVTALEKMFAAGAGKSAGLNAGWAYLVGAIGVGLAIFAALK